MVNGDPGGDQAGLPRQRHPDAADRHTKEDHQVAVMTHQGEYVPG